MGGGASTNCDNASYGHDQECEYQNYFAMLKGSGVDEAIAIEMVMVKVRRDQKQLSKNKTSDHIKPAASSLAHHTTAIESSGLSLHLNRNHSNGRRLTHDLLDLLSTSRQSTARDTARGDERSFRRNSSVELPSPSMTRGCGHSTRRGTTEDSGTGHGCRKDTTTTENENGNSSRLSCPPAKNHRKFGCVSGNDGGGGAMANKQCSSRLSPPPTSEQLSVMLNNLKEASEVLDNYFGKHACGPSHVRETFELLHSSRQSMCIVGGNDESQSVQVLVYVIDDTDFISANPLQCEVIELEVREASTSTGSDDSSTLARMYFSVPTLTAFLSENIANATEVARDNLVKKMNSVESEDLPSHDGCEAKTSIQNSSSIIRGVGGVDVSNGLVADLEQAVKYDTIVNYLVHRVGLKLKFNSEGKEEEYEVVINYDDDSLSRELNSALFHLNTTYESIADFLLATSGSTKGIKPSRYSSTGRCDVLPATGSTSRHCHEFET